MKSLITGVDGFIGTWLTKELQTRGDTVSGISRTQSGTANGVWTCTADVTDAKKIAEIIQTIKPDRIFHLAAQSNIPDSFKDPIGTMAVNVGGTLNLLEAIKTHSPQTVFVSVGSSAEYGLTAHHVDLLVEDMPSAPNSPYGISKAAQGYFSNLYFRSAQVNSIHVRPFAIIGPGKTRDAVYDFCQGVLAIEAGKSERLLTGNLAAVRDFIDVRDMVNMLIELSEKGQAGETYNICSGQGTSLKDILAILQTLSSKQIEQVVDPKRNRPADDPSIVGSIQKLTALKIQNRFSLEQTLAETLQYWRTTKK